MQPGGRNHSCYQCITFNFRGVVLNRNRFENEKTKSVLTMVVIQLKHLPLWIASDKQHRQATRIEILYPNLSNDISSREFS